MIVLSYKPYYKDSSLKGHFSLQVPKMGITLYMSHFEKNGKTWAAFPTYYDPDSERKFYPAFKFNDDEMSKTFVEKACAALQEFLKKAGVTTKNEFINDSDVPF